MRGVVAVPWKVDTWQDAPFPTAAVSVDQKIGSAAIVEIIKTLQIHWKSPQLKQDGRALRRQYFRLAATIREASHSLSAAGICLVVEELVTLNRQDFHLWQWFLQENPGSIDALAARTCCEDVMQKLSQRQTARLLWAVGRLRIQQPKLITALAWHLQPHHLSNFDLATAVWGMASAGYANPKPLLALAEHISTSGRAATFSPQSVANIAWSFAQLRIQHPGLLSSLAARVKQNGFLASVKAWGVSLITSAFASLDWRDEELMQSLALCVLERDLLVHMSEQELTILIWSFAKLRVREKGLLATITSHLLQPHAAAALSPRAIALFVWSFATLEHRDKAVLFQLAAGAQAYAARFRALDVVHVSWGFATLQIRCDSLMDALGKRVARVGFLERSGARSMANVAWAFAKLQCLSGPVLAAISRACRSRELMATFQAPDLLQMLLALALAQCPDRWLVELILSHISEERVLSLLQPSELSLMAWSMAQLQVQEGAFLAPLTNSMLRQIKLGGFQTKQLVTIFASFAKLLYRRNAILFPIGLHLASAPLQPRDLVVTAWACFRVRLWFPSLTRSLVQQLNCSVVADLSPKELVIVAYSLSWMRHRCPIVYMQLAKLAASPSCPLGIQASAMAAWVLAASCETADGAVAQLLRQLAAAHEQALRYGHHVQQVVAQVLLQPWRYPCSISALRTAKELVWACATHPGRPLSPGYDRRLREVADTLRVMGLPYEEGAILFPNAAGYRADFLLSPFATAFFLSSFFSSTGGIDTIRLANAERVRQAGSPSSWPPPPVAILLRRQRNLFIFHDRLSGRALTKLTHLQAVGYRILVILVGEWDLRKTVEEKVAFLIDQLRFVLSEGSEPLQEWPLGTPLH